MVDIFTRKNAFTLGDALLPLFFDWVDALLRYTGPESDQTRAQALPLMLRLLRVCGRWTDYYAPRGLVAIQQAMRGKWPVVSTGLLHSVGFLIDAMVWSKSGTQLPIQLRGVRLWIPEWLVAARATVGLPPMEQACLKTLQSPFSPSSTSSTIAWPTVGTPQGDATLRRRAVGVVAGLFGTPVLNRFPFTGIAWPFAASTWQVMLSPKGIFNVQLKDQIVEIVLTALRVETDSRNMIYFLHLAESILVEESSFSPQIAQAYFAFILEHALGPTWLGPVPVATGLRSAEVLMATWHFIIQVIKTCVKRRLVDAGMLKKLTLGLAKMVQECLHGWAIVAQRFVDGNSVLTSPNF
jgi:hypothetical protein